MKFIHPMLALFCGLSLLGVSALPQAGRFESPLWITYMLPQNEDLTVEARGIETKCLSTRTISNQQCQKPGCEAENEITFRRCVGVPGITFQLAICGVGSCDPLTDIGTIDSDWATSPELNVSLNRIPQAGRYVATGSSVAVSSSGCTVTGGHGPPNRDLSNQVCSKLAGYMLGEMEAAVEQGDRGKVQWFLDHGMAIDFDSGDPKYVVASGSYFNKSGTLDAPVLVWAAESGRVDMAGFLITHGAHVNAGSAGISPLIGAASKGDLSMVQFLITNGADPNLHCPLCKSTRAPQILRYLLEHGADARGLDDSGFYALAGSVACGDECLVSSQLLIERGADANRCEKDGFHSCLQMAEDGRTTFHILEDKTIQLLVAHGAHK